MDDVKTAGRWVNNHVLKPIGSAINDFVELQVQYYNIDGALRLNPRAGQPGEPMYLPPAEMSDPFKPISDKILNNATGLHINKQIKRTYDEDIADLDEKINNASSPYERSKLIKLKGVLEQERKELCKEMNKQRVNIATGVFDYIGYVPYVGVGADVINTVLYSTQKDWLSAGVCAVSAISEIVSICVILKNVDIPDVPKVNSKPDDLINNLPKNQGYDTFDKLKNALGSPGEGCQWHHIVEQSQIEKSGFNPQQIHNTSNIIAVDQATHVKITGYYNTTTFKFTNGLSVRDWLAGKSYEYQYEFGMDVLRKFGVV